MRSAWVLARVEQPQGNTSMVDRNVALVLIVQKVAQDSRVDVSVAERVRDDRLCERMTRILILRSGIIVLLLLLLHWYIR